MNIKKTTIILFILILVLPIIIISIHSTLAQTNFEQKTKSETLLSIIQKSNETIRLTIDKLEKNNITVPQNVISTYNEGIIDVKETIMFIAQEKYVEANNQALQAMKKFEVTLQLLENIIPIESTENEKIAEKIIILKANITRISEYILRLENLTMKARVLNYNTSEIENQIIILKQRLESAKQKANSLKLDDASEELKIILRLLASLKEYFIKLTNRISATNIENYLQDAETRVTSAKIDITDSTTLTQEIKEEAITALDNSETSLANARTFNENNNIDEAIKELEEAKKWENESKRIITSLTATSNSVATIKETTVTSETTNLAPK